MNEEGVWWILDSRDKPMAMFLSLGVRDRTQHLPNTVLVFCQVGLSSQPSSCI